MNPNLKASDQVTLVEKLDPVSEAPGTVQTGWVQVADFHQLLAELDVGVLGAAATIDAKLEQATDAGGTGVKDVTGSVITQLTKVGADDNKSVLINLNPQKLDVDNDFDHVRLSVTVGVAASLIAARVYGLNARFGPAAHNAAVDEVVSVV